MLIYHPAFDSHHCAMRQLMLLLSLPNSKANFVQLRILDFYFLFPAELGKMKFPNELRGKKKHWSSLGSKYNRIPDPRRVFDEIRPYQEEGMRLLAAAGLIQVDGEHNSTEVLIFEVPDAISSLIDSAIAKHSELLHLLTREFSKIDLYGASGLKARTGLFEYRYDPA